MILYINACVREESRTRHLAEYLISNLHEPVEEVRPGEIPFPAADEDFLRFRDSHIQNGTYADPCFDLARQFARADTIIVAAPFWDLSFPAALKQYFEQINVVGITFVYSPEGIPISLCRAKKLYYITTAGGPVFSYEFGYGYIKALAEGFYQIPEVRLIRAEGLDIVGADVSGIMAKAEASVDEMLDNTRCEGMDHAASDQ